MQIHKPTDKVTEISSKRRINPPCLQGRELQPTHDQGTDNRTSLFSCKCCVDQDSQMGDFPLETRRAKSQDTRHPHSYHGNGPPPSLAGDNPEYRRECLVYNRHWEPTGLFLPRAMPFTFDVMLKAKKKKKKKKRAWWLFAVLLFHLGHPIKRRLILKLYELRARTRNRSPGLSGLNPWSFDPEPNALVIGP